MIPLDEIRRAREVLDGVALRTPLVRLDVDTDAEIWLKLELLQPVRSFKIRGAGSAVLQATDEELAGGVLTASAGNMAQGLSYVGAAPRRAGDDRRSRTTRRRRRSTRSSATAAA